jgi:hypothetical protein
MRLEPDALTIWKGKEPIVIHYSQFLFSDLCTQHMDNPFEGRDHLQILEIEARSQRCTIVNIMKKHKQLID